MPLTRQSETKPKANQKSRPREPHEVVPVPGEPGRFYVKSRSAAKKGDDEQYIVDVLEREETNEGVVIGTCGCKGWSVRKTCSHLIDAKASYDASQPDPF